VITTFVATFLTACALEPISAALEDGGSGLGLSIVRLYTSVPVMAITAFVLVKVFGAVWGALTGFLISAGADVFGIARLAGPAEKERRCAKRPKCSTWNVVFNVGLVGLGALFFWLTFFVKGWVMVMGLIPFVPIVLVILANFLQAAMAFLSLFISPFVDICRGAAGCSDASLKSCKTIAACCVEFWRKSRGSDSDGDRREIGPLAAMMCGLDYFWIGNFASHIWERTPSCRTKKWNWRSVVNVLAIYVMTGLQIYVLVMDAKLLQEKPLSFFLGAVCLQGIFLPVLSLFRPLAGLFFTHA
jgi:hypothetical protein